MKNYSRAIIIIIPLIILLSFFAIIINKKFIKKDKKETIITTEKNNISRKEKHKDIEKETPWQYDYDDNFNHDSLIQAIFDTSYHFIYSDTLKLNQKKIEFAPFLLTFGDEQITLMNNNMDSIYKLKLSDEIISARWSPFSNNELYILTEKEKKLSEKQKEFSKEAYIPDVYDVNLYKLNLVSMQLIHLTSLYDYSVKMIKKYPFELLKFFYADTLHFDSSKNEIYLNCGAIQYADEDLYFIATYKIDIKNNTVTLSPFFNHNTDVNSIERCKIYKGNEFRKINYKISIGEKNSKVYGMQNNSNTYLIPNDILNKYKALTSDYMNFDEIPKNSIFENFNMDFYITPDNKYTLCSPFEILDMDEYDGDIYLINNTNNKYNLLFKKETLSSNWGRETYLYFINNKYIFTSSDMNIYDTAFNEIQKISNYSFHEFNFKKRRIN